MEQKQKIDKYIEMALFFVLGILAGVALKVEANKTVTIGFDDYKMKFSDNQYSINNLQKKINEAASAQKEENSSVQNQNDEKQENQNNS